MYNDVFHGIVLFSKEHKEMDAMVKIFTLEYGKQMFFVRQFYKVNHPLKQALQPFTQAEFVGKINRNGLSFLREYRHMQRLKKSQDDLVVQAYASYAVSLCDAAIDDRIISQPVFELLSQVLYSMDRGFDIQILTIMFEIQMLDFFGVNIDWTGCCLTGRKQGPFDFSFKYGGLIADSQWEKDKFRLHADPNALFILQRIRAVHFSDLTRIRINETLKKELRRIMDMLYDEYVGIRLKSKKFIDEMENWYDR